MLAEFFRVLTSKRRPPIAVAEAVSHLATLARVWAVYVVTPVIVLEAARGARDHRLNFWDAQLWATATATSTPSPRRSTSPRSAELTRPAPRTPRHWSSCRAVSRRLARPGCRDVSPLERSALLSQGPALPAKK